MDSSTPFPSTSASLFRLMAPDDPRGRRILLDACCLINLFASGRIEQILSVLPSRFCVAEKVTEEALYILLEDEGEDGTAEREAIGVQPLITADLLAMMRPESEEDEAAYIDFAADLDDGEAMTCALAVHRNCDVATDERKAIRILGERAPHVVVHTTASLIKAWADLSQADRQIVRRTLQSIQIRGRFRPGRQEALQSWWETMVLED